MADYRVGEEKKKIGCFGVFIIVLIVLAVLAGTVYLFLPKIISSAISGGAVSSLLPADAKRGVTEFNNLMEENIHELDKLGISRTEAASIVSSIDVKTFENIINRFDEQPVSDSAELLDILSEYVDLSAIDLNKFKSEYDFEIPRDTIDDLTDQFKENPRLMKTGFRVIQSSLIDILEKSEESDQTGSGSKKNKD